MITVRRHCDSRMSGTVYEVFDVVSGKVLLVTRDPAKGLRIAARCNSGDFRLFPSDFTDGDR
jgi:hypothetical protein